MSKSFINDVHYVRIPVVNLESSVTWYTECLGFILVHTDNENKLAVLKLSSGFLITLVEADEDTYCHFTVNGNLEFIIGFTSPEIEQFRQHLIDYGVNVDDMKEDHGHYYFHFYDPNGNKLQVHW